MTSNTDLLFSIFGLLCLGVLVLGFAGGGIYLIIRHNRDRKKAQASLGWPSVSGTVVESRVAESVSTDSDGDRTTTYRPAVRYEYEVMGTQYTGDKMAVGIQSSSSNLRKAQETVARLPVGTLVKVFYNPENPADAVLEQKISGSAPLVVGIILLVVGICLGCPGGIALLANLFRFL